MGTLIGADPFEEEFGPLPQAGQGPTPQPVPQPWHGPTPVAIGLAGTVGERVRGTDPVRLNVTGLPGAQPPVDPFEEEFGPLPQTGHGPEPQPGAQPPAAMDPRVPAIGADGNPAPRTTSSPRDWRHDQDFLGAIGGAAKRLKVRPQTLLAMIEGESDFNPRNRTGSYSGLFQLSADELKAIGVDPETYAHMSRADQVGVFVQHALRNAGYRPGDGDDQLMLVPPFGSREVRGKPDDHIVWRAGSREANANRGWLDASGNVTRGAALQFYKRRLRNYDNVQLPGKAQGWWDKDFLANDGRAPLTGAEAQNYNQHAKGVRQAEDEIRARRLELAMNEMGSNPRPRPTETIQKEIGQLEMQRQTHYREMARLEGRPVAGSQETLDRTHDGLYGLYGMGVEGADAGGPTAAIRDPLRQNGTVVGRADGAGLLGGAVPFDKPAPARRDPLAGDGFDPDPEGDASRYALRHPQPWADSAASSFGDLLGSGAAWATDKLGQLFLGEQPGWFSDDPAKAKARERQSGWVNLAAIGIPGLNVAQGIEFGGHVLGGLATDPGQTLRGIYDSIAFWDANDLEDGAQKALGLALLVAGGLHLKGRITEYQLRSEMVRRFGQYGMTPDMAARAVEMAKAELHTNRLDQQFVDTTTEALRRVAEFGDPAQAKAAKRKLGAAKFKATFSRDALREAITKADLRKLVGERADAVDAILRLREHAMNVPNRWAPPAAPEQDPIWPSERVDGQTPAGPEARTAFSNLPEPWEPRARSGEAPTAGEIAPADDGNGMAATGAGMEMGRGPWWAGPWAPEQPGQGGQLSVAPGVPRPAIDTSISQPGQQPYTVEKLTRRLLEAHPGITEQMARDVADTWFEVGRKWAADRGKTIEDFADAYLRRVGWEYGGEPSPESAGVLRQVDGGGYEKYNNSLEIDTPERHDLRKKLLADSVRGAKPAQQPTLTIILGGSGAGKSTIANAFQFGRRRAHLVDPDVFKQQLPGPKEKHSNFVHEESSLLAKRQLAELLDKRANIVYPTLGRSAEKVAASIAAAKAHGYKVRVVHVDVPVETAIERVRERAANGGIEVDEETVREGNILSRETYNSIRNEGIGDEHLLLDNAVPYGAGPRIRERTVGQIQRLGSGETSDKVFRRRRPDAALHRGGSPGGSGTPGGSQQASADEIGSTEPHGQALPETEGPSSLSQASKTGQVRGEVRIPKQFGLSKHTERAIVRLFKGSDVTTILHESAHLWRRTLHGRDLEIIENWLKVRGGEWTTAQEEKFARAIERYMMLGKTPNQRLVGTFSRFRIWFRQAYRSVKASPEIDVDIPPEVRDVFDRMFDEGSTGRERLAEKNLRRQTAEELLKLDPNDPRLDPFGDEYDVDLATGIVRALAGPYEDSLYASDVLRDVQDELYQLETSHELDSERQVGIADYLREHLGHGTAEAYRLVKVNGKWRVDKRQVVPAVYLADIDPSVQPMVLDYIEHGYVEPEYRLVPLDTPAKMGNTSWDTPPEGARTVSEWATREGDDLDTGAGSGARRNRIPTMILQQMYDDMKGGGIDRGAFLDRVRERYQQMFGDAEATTEPEPMPAASQSMDYDAEAVREAGRVEELVKRRAQAQEADEDWLKRTREYQSGRMSVIERKAYEAEARLRHNSVHEPARTYGQQAFDFDQLELDFREGTNPQQRELARRAATDLARRERSAPVARSILREYQRGAGAQLVGQHVAGPEDLAVLAQILRDPRYETLRLLWVQGNTIVGHDATSQRLPGMVSFAGLGQTDAEVAQYVKDQAAKYGADALWALHNHPSGDPAPSPEDIQMTHYLGRRAAEVGITLHGHVVIDFNRYAVIDHAGQLQQNLPIQMDRDPVRQATGLKRGVRILGRDVARADDVVAIGKRLQRAGYATLIHVSTKGKVAAIYEMPMADMIRAIENLSPRFMADLRREGRSQGAGLGTAISLGADYTIRAGEVVRLADNAAMPKLTAGIHALMDRGLLLDVVTDDVSSMQRGHTRTEAGYHLGRQDMRENWLARETSAQYQSGRRTGALSGQDLEDYAAIAARLEKLGKSQVQIQTELVRAYKLDREDAMAARRAGRRMVRMEAQLEAEDKLAPRVIELHLQGYKQQQIVDKLADEQQAIGKSRLRKLWTRALRDAGLDRHGPDGPTAGDAAAHREAAVLRSMADAAPVIVRMQAGDSTFVEIAQMLADEHPEIPKSRYQDAFLRAVQAAGATIVDSEGNPLPVVTRLNAAGDRVAMVLGGGAVTIPASVAKFLDTARHPRAARWIGDVIVNTLSGGRWPREQYMTEKRLLDHVAGEDPELQRWLIGSRENAVTAMTDELATWRDRLREEVPIALDRKSSALIMQYGEGKIGKDDLPEDQADAIIAADKWFRQNYDDVLQRVNRVLRKYGKPEIMRRSNYYTHMQEDGGMVSQLMQAVRGSKGGTAGDMVGAVATTGAARTVRLNPFAQQRLGDKTVYDALNSFETWLYATLAQIYLTKPAMRHAALAAAVIEHAALMRRDPQLAIEERLGKRDDMKGLEIFAKALVGYQRELSGQRQESDAANQDGPLGPFINAAEWLARRFGSAVIPLSIRSALMQLSPLKWGLAEYGPIELGRALMANRRDGGILDESPFLRRRYTDLRSARIEWRDVMRKGAMVPLEAIEEPVVEMLWRAEYERALAHGHDQAEAIRFADDYIERTVAGRAIGEKPLVFLTAFGRIVAQFQLEKANDLQRLLTNEYQRGPAYRRKNGGRRDRRWAMVGLLASIWVFNELYDHAFNDRPEGGDLIQMLADELRIATAKAPAGKKAAAMLGRVAGEGISMVPGGQLTTALTSERDVMGTGLTRRQFFGRTDAGTLPATVGIMNLIQSMNLGDILRYFIIPYGGNQISKTVRGLDAITGGRMHERLGKLPGPIGAMAEQFSDSHIVDENKRRPKYPVRGGDIPRALLFGPYATDAAEESTNRRVQLERTPSQQRKDARDKLKKLQPLGPWQPEPPTP